MCQPITLLEAERDEDKKYDKYEIDSACDTLIRAEEIKQNKKLMKEVSKCLAKRSKAIRSVRDIRDAAEEFNEDED